MLHDKIQYGNFFKQYSSLTQLGETGEVGVVKFRVTQFSKSFKEKDTYVHKALFHRHGN
jgi:hypothetical protein